MGVREIDEFQNSILDNAFRIAQGVSDSSIINNKINKSLCWIAEHDVDNGSYILGPLAKSLHKFCNIVDLSHPYLSELFKSYNIDNERMSLICEVLEVSPYLRSKKLNLLSDLIRNQFIKFREMPKEFCYKIKKPPVRILKNYTDRQEARKVKQPSVLAVSSVLDDSSALPTNFKSYFCGYNYEDELKEQEAMRDVFSSVQAAAFTNKVSAQMEVTKKRVSEQYYGFVRLRPVDAAMILAKSMGLHWKRGTRYIQVPRSIFSGSYVFWNGSYNSLSSLKYQPNKYPLHAFGCNVPEKLAKILDLVENYPMVGNKPIFDHFWVVCPSFHLDAKEFCSKPNIWKLRIGGEEQIFEWSSSAMQDSEINKASMALDVYMTKSGFMTPVVLGEVNGQCFFICFWN